MNEKIKIAVKKIVTYAQRDQEFVQELKKALDFMPTSSSVQALDNMQSDVSAIREALHIRANCSISYDFIPQSAKYQRLKEQLIIDNLRMENAAISLMDDEKERFYTFCVNAFYQIENIINYYYYVLYPSIDDLQKSIEEGTSSEKEPYQYHRNRNSKVENVADISISYKLNAFCNSNLPDIKDKITYGLLRKVRNEGEHRCMVLLQEKDESLYKFYRYNSFNDIRRKLIKLVRAVERGLKEKK